MQDCDSADGSEEIEEMLVQQGKEHVERRANMKKEIEMRELEHKEKMRNLDMRRKEYQERMRIKLKYEVINLKKKLLQCNSLNQGQILIQMNGVNNAIMT